MAGFPPDFNPTTHSAAGNPIDGDFREKPDYRGHIELAVNAGLLSASVIFVTLRVYIRAFVKNAFGLDDIMAIVALASVAGMAIVDIKSIDYGSGAHFTDIPAILFPTFFIYQSTLSLLYFNAIGMVRLAILTFIPRLYNTPLTVWSGWILGGMIVAQTAICFFFKLTMCSPIRDSFAPPVAGMDCRPLSEQDKMMRAHSITGIIFDAYLFALPLYVVYTKMMWSRRTVQVLLVMSVGLFVIAAGIVRAVLITVLDFFSDSTYNMSIIGVWTNVECNIGLWVCCWPTLQPLVRAITVAVGLRSNVNTTNPSGSGSGVLNTIGGSGAGGSAGGSRIGRVKSKHGGYIRNGGSSMPDIDSDDGDSQQGIIDTSRDPKGLDAEGGVELTKFNFNGGDGPGIHRTTEVTVESHRMDQMPGKPPY